MNFNDTYAPVVKFTSVRVVLARSVRLDLELNQMDVKTAFLSGDLEKEIFMEVPQGIKYDTSKVFVCKLNIVLYGSKRAPCL